MERARLGDVDYLAVSRGIGTLLVEAAEQPIRNRELCHAELGVEEDDPGVRALYERLGDVAFDRRPDAWDEQAPNGGPPTVHCADTKRCAP